MSQRLRIALDNSQALYFPGQTVSGKVFLCNDLELVIQGVSIKFSGESQTKWEEGSKTHSANEVYYVKRYFLLGNGTDAESLNPGEHIYRFSFKLPLNIPSSYETYTGQVRHQCKAKVHRWEGANWEVVRPFSVNTLYDLNLDEDAKLPVNKKAIKGFLLSDGSMSIKLLMERTGFVPGEKIRIHCEVNNDSNKDIKCVKLALIKDAIYHASSGSISKYTLTLAKIVKNYIDAPGINVIWSDTGPIVPPVPPSYLQHCNIIDMRYTLKVVLCPGKFRKKIEIAQPIIIGSIPLAEHFRRYRMIGSRRETNDSAEQSSNPGLTSHIGAQSSNPRPTTHFTDQSSNSRQTSHFGAQSSNSRQTSHFGAQTSNPRSSAHFGEQSSMGVSTSNFNAQAYNPRPITEFAEQFSNLGPISPPHGASALPISEYASAVLGHANSYLDPDSDNPPSYNPDWADNSEEPPIHPGHNHYSEMPPPSYIESQHSVHNKYASNSNGTPQNPFIPSYLVFNPSDSRPGTPTCEKRKPLFV